MRIGIDIRALMEGKTTGVEVYLDNLLRNLFELDQKNNYILFANSFNKVEEKIKRYNYPNVSYKVSRYPNKIFNSVQKLLNYPKIDRVLGGVDVFFSPHWRSTAISSNIPLILTFHDLAFEVFPEFLTVKQRLWHRFMNYRKAANLSSKIITVSQNTKKDLINFYEVKGDKITVIYPGMPKIFQNGNNEQKYFLYFGTKEPRKNVQTVIDAYEFYLKASEIKRSLVIAGAKGWKTKLRIGNHLQSNIEVLEMPSDRVKHELYQNCFALLFPSFYEGFGFPVVEAASFKKPVITTYSSSLAEISSNFAYFVNPFRPELMGEIMLELENNPTTPAFIGSEFDWNATAKELINLFESVSK